MPSRGARLGIGLREPASPAKLRAAALDGSIEDLLEWHPVTPGDFFYIPANTVHAIGGGVSLVEVQQNSDITYRLYDYGRPRELHLDAGLAVAHGGPHPASCRRKVPAEGAAELVEGPLFRLDRLAGRPGPDVLARYGAAPVLAIPLRGTATIGAEAIAPGECGLAGALAELVVPDDALVLVAQPIG